MNIALILAGGWGKRTNQKVPKQYLTVFDKPLIVYTLENVQSSECFDRIYVVCSDSWKAFVRAYANQYDVSLSDVIIGGETRFESYLNGISFLKEIYSDDDVITLIDGNRPLIPKEVFKNNIAGLNDNDIVVSVEPCYDTMYIIDSNNIDYFRVLNRETVFKGQTPESARLGLAYDICTDKSITNEDVALTNLFLKFGRKVAVSQGSVNSFKITKLEDLELFKVMITAH